MGLAGHNRARKEREEKAKLYAESNEGKLDALNKLISAGNVASKELDDMESKATELEAIVIAGEEAEDEREALLKIIEEEKPEEETTTVATVTLLDLIVEAINVSDLDVVVKDSLVLIINEGEGTTNEGIITSLLENEESKEALSGLLKDIITVYEFEGDDNGEYKNQLLSLLEVPEVNPHNKNTKAWYEFELAIKGIDFLEAKNNDDLKALLEESEK